MHHVVSQNQPPVRWAGSVVCTLVLVLMAVPLSGANREKSSADSLGVRSAHPADRGATEPAKPSFVRGGKQLLVSARTAIILKRGLRIAEGRLREHASCRELFDAFGRDGWEELNQSHYHWAATDACPRNASAYTWVGASRTCLCPSFADLSSKQAAVALIHEALHHAGLTEQPADPLGMTPNQIDQLVKASCRL